jgi:hypothetical protein
MAFFVVGGAVLVLLVAVVLGALFAIRTPGGPGR